MTEYKANCTYGGYYQKNVKVWVSRKLSYMPYAQAGVRFYPGKVQLVSYETIVAEIVDGWVFCYGTFSASTRRHIGAFCKEFLPGFSYQDMKMLYTYGEKCNIYTGELLPVEEKTDEKNEDGNICSVA